MPSDRDLPVYIAIYLPASSFLTPCQLNRQFRLHYILAVAISLPYRTAYLAHDTPLK